MHLGVSRRNTGAVEFYRRVGFEEWGSGDAINQTFVRAITPR